MSDVSTSGTLYGNSIKKYYFHFKAFHTITKTSLKKIIFDLTSPFNKCLAHACLHTHS